MFTRAVGLCNKHAAAFASASAEYGVPVELLMACTLTEAARIPKPACGKSPATSPNEKTPSRISAGMCQLLISTARGIMKDPNIDRAWLFNPQNSLDA
jgi:hypothetical protein